VNGDGDELAVARLPVVIPQERAERASVGIAVPAAMSPFLHGEGRGHRVPHPDPDTRLACGEAPAG